MRRVFVGIAVALALTAAAQAGEPVPGQFNVTFGGGINVPSAEAARNGYIIGGGVGYQVSPRLVIGGEVSYLGYQRDGGDSGGAGSPLTATASQHFVDYMATAKYFVKTAAYAPYVKGFAGRYNFTYGYTVDTQSGSFSYADLQYGGGVGLLVTGREESNLYFEVLARQLQLEVGRTRIYTFTMGMDFNFPL